MFLEQPVLPRKKGFDRWVTSGGRKGATETWLSDTDGVLKRYARVVHANPELGAGLKCAQYNLLSRSGPGAEAVENKTKQLWNRAPPAVEPTEPAAPVAPFAPLLIRAPQAQTALELVSAPQQPFISFQSAAAGEEGLELGAIARHGRGIKLESTQGDFAEWHRRTDGELPFEEGDVVGFHRGQISRVTKRCEMLGIVSRKAVVEGSAPPVSERHLWDTVAYCGVVPVKLRKGGSLGAVCDCDTQLGGVLVSPSGRNDGTAVVAPAASDATPRVGILHDASFTEVVGEGVRLVQVVVIAPAETVRGQGFSRTGRIRALVQCLLAFMLLLTAGTVALYPRSPAPGLTLGLGLQTCVGVECAEGSHPGHGVSSCCDENICRAPSAASGSEEFDEIRWTNWFDSLLSADTKEVVELVEQCAGGGALSVGEGVAAFSSGCSQIPDGWSEERAVSTCTGLCAATGSCTGFTLYDKNSAQCEPKCVDSWSVVTAESTADLCAAAGNTWDAADRDDGYWDETDPRAVVWHGPDCPSRWQGPVACCFHTAVAGVGGSLAMATTLLNQTDFGRKYPLAGKGLERSSRCFIRRQASGYSIQNLDATRVSELGLLGCAPGWSEWRKKDSLGRPLRVDATCPISTGLDLSANMDEYAISLGEDDGSAPAFIVSGCVPNQCRTFHSSVSYGNDAFQKKHPPSARSATDFLGGANVEEEEAFQAFLAGGFSNTSGAAPLASYIVHDGNATTVAGLGNIGCRLGYFGQPSVDCQGTDVESAFADPAGLGKVEFTATGCAPRDSCVSVQTCANRYGAELAKCQGLAVACAAAQALFTEDVVANHAACDAAENSCCQYCMTDDRLPLLPPLDPGPGAIRGQQPAMKCAQSRSLMEGRLECYM